MEITIENVRIGDIITNGKWFKMVLDIFGTNSIYISRAKQTICELDTLEEYLEKGDCEHHYIQELIKNGYKIYNKENSEKSELLKKADELIAKAEEIKEEANKIK